MIEETAVAGVVAEVSTRMTDPNYSQIAVGRFVEAQPNISRYLSARASDLGGEAVIVAVFHAELVRECVAHDPEAIRTVSFPDLDTAAQGKPLTRLEKSEPALFGYLISNVDEEPLREVLAVVAHALVGARA